MRKNVSISLEDIDFMKRSDFLESDLVRKLDDADVKDGENRILSIDKGTAERFRSAFTEKLALSGFDSDYGLNDEGRRLENLIDKFFF